MSVLEELQESKWFLSRPKKVQEVILKYPPGSKYKLESSGHIVILYSYEEEENGDCEKCSVLVLHEYNPGLLFERKVFGIDLKDLQTEEGELG